MHGVPIHLLDYIISFHVRFSISACLIGEEEKEFLNWNIYCNVSWICLYTNYSWDFTL